MPLTSVAGLRIPDRGARNSFRAHLENRRGRRNEFRAPLHRPAPVPFSPFVECQRWGTCGLIHYLGNCLLFANRPDTIRTGSVSIQRPHPMDTSITLVVNGQTKTVTTDPSRPLLEVLREDLQLTGTKHGCGDGYCGACTVLMNGQRTHACLTPVGDAAGKAILTIEGLASGGALHPVQKAFLEEHAFQCGYCTPGMILSTVALLREKPNPTDAEIAELMDGNLCRCCGYPRIFKAIHRAAGRLATARTER